MKPTTHSTCSQLWDELVQCWCSGGSWDPRRYEKKDGARCAAQGAEEGMQRESRESSENCIKEKVSRHPVQKKCRLCLKEVIKSQRNNEENSIARGIHVSYKLGVLRDVATRRFIFLSGWLLACFIELEFDVVQPGLKLSLKLKMTLDSQSSFSLPSDGTTVMCLHPWLAWSRQGLTIHPVQHALELTM